jgi:hypothetical protein
MFSSSSSSSLLVYVGQAKTNFYKLVTFLNVRDNIVIIVISHLRHGARGSIEVKALRYKPESLGLETRLDN